MSDLDDILDIQTAIEAMYMDPSITDFRLLSLVEMVVVLLKKKEERSIEDPDFHSFLVVEEEGKEERVIDQFKVKFYVDGIGEHRWRAVSRNGETVADSGEGYRNLADCKEEAKKLFGFSVEYEEEETP